MKLVLDTDVVVAAMRSPSGASARLLRLAARRALTPLVTPTLILQYEEVCRRPQHMKAAGFSTAEAETFLELLLRFSERVRPSFSWRPLVRDAGDEMVMQAALAGRAAAIVTFNVRDFGDAPARFGIGLLRPGELLKELEP